MNLYLISQTENNGYDTYDSAVVAAETPEDAARIHPDGSGSLSWGQSFGTWAKRPENVKVELIGTATEGTRAGVICASFNAG